MITVELAVALGIVMTVLPNYFRSGKTKSNASLAFLWALWSEKGARERATL